MKKHIILTILLSILLIPTVTNAANVTVKNNFNNNTLVTGQNDIGYFSIENLGNTTQKNINYEIRRLPFNITFSPDKINDLDAKQNVTVTVKVPKYFEPGDYTGQLIVSNDNFSIERDFEVTVNETNNLSLVDSNITENVSTGSDGKLGTLTLSNEGNIRNDVRVNVTGNLTEHLLYNELVSIYPGHEKDIIFEYQIDKTTEFGTYVANVTLIGNERTINTTLKTQFLDTIIPKYSNTNIDNFMATKPDNFTLKAEDNLDVSVVNATVEYDVQREVNNTTVTETLIYETLNFVRKDNSNVWTVRPKSDRIGEYRLYGTIYDSSSNVVEFNDTYRIQGLNVTTIDETVEFERYKNSNLVSMKVGRVDEKTDLTFGLANFNQPLSSENETWQVAIGINNKKRFFEDKSDKLEYEDVKGDILLYVYGSEADRYNGLIKTYGIKQHVDINDLTFSGEFVNYSVPEDNNFTISGSQLSCIGVKSKVIDEAGYNCDIFIPATKFQDKNIEDMVMIPKTFYDEEKNQWDRIEDRKDNIIEQNWLVIKILGIVLGILGYLFVYVWKYLPSTYGTYLKDTERLK